MCLLRYEKNNLHLLIWSLLYLFFTTELTEDIVKCCSACFNRIARKLGAMGTEPENPIPEEGQREQPEQSQGNSWT